uniref:Helicase ATP-binding domain-containing protein n=1 Tax=viral metagenome TaxID=1070528 RepID=A0A6M3LIX1_9ZZZZ
MAQIEYEEFLSRKTHLGGEYGFDPVFLPSFLFDFQKALIEWALRKGRAAIFADCGLGKTPMQLVWAENIVRKENKPVLIITPLAVSHQTIREGEKFGIECHRSGDGSVKPNITVTNYERLHLFNVDDFIGVVCDESSILKNFDGKRKAIITEFMRTRPYRLCCTATAAPNDYVELGTTSEALGELGYMDMLTRFFRNVDSSTMGGSHGFRFKHKEKQEAFRGKASFWRFKKHAEVPFWRWVASWSRAIRKPSDMGFDDKNFILPTLSENEIIIKRDRPLNGQLFVLPAVGLKEEREERRETITERCEAVARTVNGDFTLSWCHLNDEGDMLEKIIPGSLQVAGKHSDEEKEDRILSFINGQTKILITKPKVAGFGLNLQHCAHITFFPSHSFEQYYQGVRRCWRFGQKRPVTVDIITSQGEVGVLKNLKRKADAADKMFSELVLHMNDALAVNKNNIYNQKMEAPEWL